MLLFQKMARQISPVCNFISGFLHTCLPMNMVDVELTIRMVKGIYTYHKDHTAESTVFSPWSVIPFPSLRCKIQAFQDDNSKPLMTWNSSMMPQFSAPPRPRRSPRKHPQAKLELGGPIITTSSIQLETNRYNTNDTEPNDMNKINIIQPTPKRACECTDSSCIYCKYEAPHPSPVPLDWSSED